MGHRMTLNTWLRGTFTDLFVVLEAELTERSRDAAAKHHDSQQYKSAASTLPVYTWPSLGVFQPCWFFQMPLPSFVSWRALCCLGLFYVGLFSVETLFFFLFFF